jgi:alkanesulfonate monooxygenase SsuD/methylene tetrahydromethanopterin reductase-like flavin-dependent oxidoreductase (luciferase family)
MKFGVFLPISGRAASSVLMEAARSAEAFGYASVWAADRIVTPWQIDTPYPYSADQRFIVPPDVPFLEPLTCLAYLAGGTERIALGMSVLVMPYRHPLHWAKIATTIDHLARGRLILGVGVGSGGLHPVDRKEPERHRVDRGVDVMNEARGDWKWPRT